MLDRFLTVNLNYKNHSPHLDLQKEVVTLNENVVKMSNPKTNSTAPSALNKFILSCHAKITKNKNSNFKFDRVQKKRLSCKSISFPCLYAASD